MVNETKSARITVQQIVHRLGLGRQAVYALLKQGTIPTIRLGRRWIVTRHAYEQMGAHVRHARGSWT
jgi:excisionase family DNA binding protein